jgi:hypothetical protein
MNKFNKAFALPNEVWSPVKGYEGLYAVSSMGRVKSLERFDRFGRLVKERILKPEKNKNGYLIVALWKDGKGKMFYVHRLVAQAFLKPVAGKDFINHRDEVKVSNHYLNLEFCSHKENCNWGTAIKRRVEKCSKTVYQYSLDGEFIREYPSTHEVERQTGYSQVGISDCCRGRLKTAYGYIWQYK